MARGPKRQFEARCPQHPGSSVKSHGTRPGPPGAPPRRRFKCRPLTGAEHVFTAVMGEGPEPVPVPVFSPAPACPEHPGSKVVRNGRYATSTEAKRQIYRCTPEGEDEKPHKFVPGLARAHVHVGAEACAACEELRGTHRGDRTVARRHSWSARLVAEALKELAGGKSYAAVGREMRRKTGRKRTRRVRDASGNLVDREKLPSKPKRVKYAGSEVSANAWHIAADWVEAFSPVIWDHVEPKIAAADAEARAANDAILAQAAAEVGQPGIFTAGSLVKEAHDTEYRSPLSRPMVLMLDDIPVHVKGRRDYFVLVAAQVEWANRPALEGEPAKTIGRGVKLRAVRGYGTNANEAWKLLLAEVGYRPDFIVADRGKGLVKAVGDAFGPTVPILPSLHHMRAAIERSLVKIPAARQPVATNTDKYMARILVPDLANHLDGLRRHALHTMTLEEWHGWWDDLAAIMTNLRLPAEKVRRWRKEYEDLVGDLLPIYRAYPQLPVSSGGLEVALRQRIHPVLAGRAHAFGNLERVNRLFDLVVARDHGYFDDLVAVAELLRADASDNDGWATPLRDVQDVRTGTGAPYSSLRDQQLIRNLAAKAVTP